MIFHIPHASHKIPPEVRPGIVLTEEQLTAEILKITDWFTDDLFGGHAAAGDSVLACPVSRLVVDPERFLDDKKEPMASVGMGVIYTRTSDGSQLRAQPTDAERDELLRTYYHPHHKCFSDAVTTELKQCGRAVILDCHSFPSKPLAYELDRNPDRPDICIGTDDYHTPASLLDAVERQCRAEALSFALNRPFAGAITPIARNRIDKNVCSFMIEVNRRLYMDESRGIGSRDYGDCRMLVGRLIEAAKSSSGVTS